MPSPRIFLSAGEASGEHYGASLIPAIRRLAPHADFFGLGGCRMEATGFRPIVRAEDVAVMGITEVLAHMPRIYREYRRLKAAIRAERPSLAILIDFPDVNLSLAKHLHRAGIPVLYFVSPQLWAWKKYRIRDVRRYVDQMLVIFPFEEPFYRERGVHAAFIGHPLADLPLPEISREVFARENHLDPSKHWVALLPGSRAKEIRLNLPVMVQATQILYQSGPYEFLLPLAPTLTGSQREQIQATLPANPKISVTRDARATLHHARAAAVASGTATVEAALIGNPFVVVYRVSHVSYAIAKRFVHVPHVAMANLIAGRRVVPELIQTDFTAENLVTHLKPLLHDEAARTKMQAGLREISDKLEIKGESGGESGAASVETTIDRAAHFAAQMLHPQKLHQKESPQVL